LLGLAWLLPYAAGDIYIQPSAIPRHWKVSRKLDVNVDDEIDTDDFDVISNLSGQRVLFKKNKTVDFGNGERGIWDVKQARAILEVEVDVSDDENAYLLYQIPVREGRIHKHVARFEEEGKVYLVKGIPLPWNKKLVGRFRIEPDDFKLPAKNMKV